MIRKSLILPVSVSLFIILLLTPVQLMVEMRMLMLDRFIPGGGFIEIVIIAFYGGFVAYKMQDPRNVAKWRLRTWSLFSWFFFTQLILGMLVSEKFLLTGKLHLPIPMMILGGPIYRGQLSVMTLLFLSTILLTGPAWCSHLCYFGALDALASNKKGRPAKLKALKPFKNSMVVLIIVSALLLRFSGITNTWATILAITFGLTGIGIILFVSRKKKQMVHCVQYCPIGTIVNYTKFVNPFRMKIDSNCTNCMACTATCRYNALKPADILQKKPGITCTLCGDCVQSCHTQSIHYRFFKMKPANARLLYLFLTISFHAVFMALGRI
ncbi:4Fe-4S binding protein [Saccharicrinis sp. FJH54]|uniref:4Fe-4S binding protein n=1 Tax=Saccharicrinis sp. FJH54 TaxID=3344665 RepID=UPI0035D4BEAF